MDDDLEIMRDLLVAHLAASGPTSFDDVVEAFLDDEQVPATDEDDLIDLIEAVTERFDAVRITGVDDLVLASTAAVLDGWTFLHRLSQAEVDAGLLSLDPTVELAAASGGAGIELGAEGPAEVLHGEEIPAAHRGSFSEHAGAVVAPAPWLEGRAAGDLLGLAISGNRIDLLPEAPSIAEDRSAAFAAALAAQFDEQVVERTGIASYLMLMLDVLTVPPVERGPLPFVDDLLAAAHLERRGDWVGRRSSGWLTPSEQYRARQIAAAERRYVLDGHTAADLRLLVDAHEAVLRGHGVPDNRTLGRLGHGLGHDEVTAAAVDVLLGTGVRAGAVEAMHTLAIALVDGADGPQEAGARVLLARCAEHDGDHRAMEAHLTEALAADPQYWPALADAAWFAEDRGDSGRAISLLTETRVPAFAEEIERISRFHRSGELKVGRNDPCPCGSGRKYKACCLGQGGFSLAERSIWLLHKVQGFMARSPQVGEVENLVFAMAGTYRGLEVEDLALEDYPMVADLALFEGGGLGRFLEQRGHLLPPDERELAESWLGRALALWRVEGRDGVAVMLVPMPDPLAADPAVPDPGGPASPIRLEGAPDLADLPVGSIVLVRPLPVPGDVWRAVGFTQVVSESPSLRMALGLAAEAGAAAATMLARVIGGLNAAPPDTIDDGDPLVLRSISYSLPPELDPDDVAGRLDDELYDPDESGEWVEVADADLGDSANGSVTLTEDVLVVRAASDRRADRLVEVVERLVPEAVRTAESRKSREELMEEMFSDDLGDGLRFEL